MTKFTVNPMNHNNKYDIILRNQLIKTNVNQTSYISSHKRVIEIRGWIKNDRTFIKLSPSLKCLGLYLHLALIQKNTIICLARL